MGLDRLPIQKKSGIWLPTLTIVTNIDALTFLNGFYVISGNLVQCYLAASVDPTGGATWAFRASLPFGIDLAADSDLIGVCAPSVSGGFGGTVRADPTNNEALFQTTHSVGALDVYAHFAYRIP